MTQFNLVRERLPVLVDMLRSIKPDYAHESRYIGEACGYLRLLEDLLKAGTPKE